MEAYLREGKGWGAEEHSDITKAHKTTPTLEPVYKSKILKYSMCYFFMNSKYIALKHFTQTFLLL